ncbi:excalibur calcium-binding domain-containing protein [Streptomyces flaveolus]|uniref:excalibur calcium-binding domain-containing protein n=1 Tax=Streptomyces flaveolus TaxID=67297 RepID=UPI003F5756CD
MTNPYTTPQQPPLRTAPKWARKRYVLPTIGLAFFLGIGAGASDQNTGSRAKPAADKVRATATVTATATATETVTPEPAPTVTETKAVKVKVTVTAHAAAAVSGAGAVRQAVLPEAAAPTPRVALSEPGMAPPLAAMTARTPKPHTTRAPARTMEA